jgi:hypothetical protein
MLAIFRNNSNTQPKNKVYSYNETENSIRKQEKTVDEIGNIVQIDTIVNLSKNTIKRYANNIATNNVSVTLEERSLDFNDIYIFREMIDTEELVKNDKMSSALCNCEYYAKFLSFKADIFDMPYTSFFMRYFCGATTIIAPFYMIEMQLWLRPKFTLEIINAYNKYASMTYIIGSNILRLSLVGPSLCISPFVYGSAVLRLNDGN